MVCRVRHDRVLQPADTGRRQAALQPSGRGHRPAGAVSVSPADSPSAETRPPRPLGSAERAHLAAIIESSNDAIIGKSLDGIITSWNPAAERIFGYSAAEAIGQPLLTLFPADRVHEEAEIAARIARGERVRSFETVRRRKDGSLIDVSVTISPIIDERGTIVGASKIARDISETKSAARVLRASETRFHAVFEQAGIGIAIDDPDTLQIRDCNPALAGMLGYTVAELRGRTIESISEPEDFALNRRLVDELVSGARTRFAMEKRYRHRDGREVVGLLTGTLVHDASTDTRLLLGMVEDITDRKRVVADLRASREMLQTLVDASPLAIVAYDTGGKVTEWNEGATRMFGWNADEAIGRYCPTIPDDGRPAYEAMLQQVMRDGPATGMLVERWRKDGSRLLTNISAASLRGAAGWPDGVMAVLEDVTDRRRAEEHRLRTQRLESIGTLAGGIAHDLNNVLAPILLSIDLLRQAEPDSDRRAMMDGIEASARRGADLVRQVLTFARGVEGRREAVDPGALLVDLCKIIEETFPKQIEVQCTLPPVAWPVLGDTTQLHQVLLNLAVNARDAMPSGGLLTLALRHVELGDGNAGLEPQAVPGRYVVFEVSDSGTGMPSEVLDRIFEPFFTTKAIGAGTGLGLSTSMAILRSHGGFIRVYSEPGRGSRFRVYLPAAVDLEGESDDAPQGIPRGRGEQILVVDDEPSIRAVVGRTLEANGYRAMLAADGGEALDLMTRHGEQIAVVVSDMMMPGIDGMELVVAITSIQPEVRIIMTSGLDASAVVGTGPHANVRGFLLKPFSALDLLSMIRRVIDGETNADAGR